MVWEKSIVVLVMLCGMNEEGRLKCDIYFPDRQLSREVIRIGNDFEVSLANIDTSNAFYWVRTFNLKNLRTGQARVVTQYHVSSLESILVTILDFRACLGFEFN